MTEYVAQPHRRCWSVAGASRGWKLATTHNSDSQSFIEALQEVAERVKERQVKQ